MRVCVTDWFTHCQFKVLIKPHCQFKVLIKPNEVHYTENNLNI